MRRPLRAVEFFAERLKCRGVIVVAVHVTQQPAQLVEGRGIDAAVFLQAVVRAGLKLFEVPTGFGHADDRHVEVAALHHRLQRREDLLVGQIAGGAEKDQGVGMGIRSLGNLLYAAFVLPSGFSSVRRIRSASPRAVCPDNPPRRAR